MPMGMWSNVRATFGSIFSRRGIGAIRVSGRRTSPSTPIFSKYKEFAKKLAMEARVRASTRPDSSVELLTVGYLMCAWREMGGRTILTFLINEAVSGIFDGA